MFGVGTILAGKYRVERVLGEGGMGIVVAATHMHLGTPVALKFLLAEMAQSQQMAERFLREARASAQLKSEHVCRVSDVGMLDTGAPYIVMELLNGQDLSSILRTHGPLNVQVAADYILQACVALAEAHAAGIVHRDLKPGNLFWTQRPDGSTLIKVLDFGIAKASTPGGQNFSMTQTSAVMGSPGYMSPEQLKSSRDVDARSDIWSLGCVLFELVTGRPPFHGESITELAVRVVMDPTPPLPPTLPRPFEGVISRCLEKDPARRFQDVAELAMALAPFVGPRGVEMANGVTRVLRGANAVAATVPPTNPNYGGVGTSPPGTQPHGRAVTTPTTLGAATGQLQQVKKGRGGLIAMVAGGVVVAVIAVVAITMGGGKGDDKKPAPAAAPTQPAPTETASPPPPPPVETKPTPTETAPPAETKPTTATVPTETATPPPETKPAETKPAETKPVETKPADPVATTPANTASPTETKPTTKKSTTTKKKTTTKKRPEDIGDSRI